MKTGCKFLSLTLVTYVTSCAAPNAPSFALPPEPPTQWKNSIGSVNECNDIAGEYELVPTVAELQENKTWQISTGTWFDSILLFPYDVADSSSWTPVESARSYSRNSMIIEVLHKEGAIKIVSPVRNSNEFLAHVLRIKEGDFVCESGRILFPEFRIKGGTEGSTIEGSKYRFVTITMGGNLLFYEQVKGDETVHKYFLFAKKNVENKAKS